MELAKRAAVGVATVNRFEASPDGATASTISAIERAFRTTGIIFSDDGDGIRMRRFREGDLVRIKSQYRFRYGLNDEIGKITQVEAHPPATGPTYRAWAEFPNTKKISGVFSSEFELVKEAPELLSSNLSDFQVLRDQSDFDGVIIHCFDRQRLAITFVPQSVLEDTVFPLDETIHAGPSIAEWANVVEANLDLFIKIANRKYAKGDVGVLKRYGSTLPFIEISLADMREEKASLRLPNNRFSWQQA